jgi:hypothetical protein
MVTTEAQAAGLHVVASDTVSKQTDISGLVKWHSLSNDSPKIWADTILECVASRVTQDMSQTIAAAGYDIGAEAEKLAKLYMVPR